MDQIDDVCSDYVQIKGEQSIVLKMKAEREKEKDAKVVLTNPVSYYISFSISNIFSRVQTKKKFILI